jgi:hypothetical protein
MELAVRKIWQLLSSKVFSALRYPRFASSKACRFFPSFDDTWPRLPPDLQPRARPHADFSICRTGLDLNLD